MHISFTILLIINCYCLTTVNTVKYSNLLKSPLKINVENTEFVNGFRRFWGDVIELATLAEDFVETPSDAGDPTSNPDIFFSTQDEFMPDDNEQDPIVVGNPVEQPAIPTDIEPDLGFVSDDIVQKMVSLVRNANPAYYKVLLMDRKIVDRLLVNANINQWTSVLENRLTPSRINAIINKFWRGFALSEWEYEQLVKQLKNTGKIEYFKQLFVQFYLMRTDNLLEEVEMLERKVKALIYTIRHILLVEVRVSDFINIEEVLLNPNIGLDISSMPEVMQDLFRSTVIDYFNFVGYTIIGRMVSAVLKLPAEESKNESALMTAALNRCGPGMQKIMQLMGKNAKSERLKEFLDKLKDAIEPMSDEERTKVIEHTVGGFDVLATGTLPEWVAGVNPPQFKTPEKRVRLRLISLDKPVGSASIGEGWIATVQFEGREGTEKVFVKLMRWDIGRFLQKEIEFLNRLKMQKPEMTNIIDELTDSLKEETDFRMEAANQLLGYKMHDTRYLKLKKSSHLYVPKPKAVFASNRAGIIVMPMENGETMKKILSRPMDNGQACAVVNLHVRFMREWIFRLMLGEGVGHGDPHSGNILIDFHRDPKQTSMIILDWGNVIRISKEVQVQLNQYATGILLRDEWLIMDALGRPTRNQTDPNSNDPMLNRDHEKWIELKQKISEQFHNLRDILIQRKRSIGHSNNIHNLLEDSIGSGSETASEEGDNFSLRSPRVRNRIVNDANWEMGDSLLILLDNTISDAVNNGLNIPPGTAGMLRARRFLEDALEDLRKHPSVVRARCNVPKPFSIFFWGLAKVTKPNLVASMQSMKYLAKSVVGKTRRGYRRVKDKCASGMRCYSGTPGQVQGEDEDIRFTGVEVQ